MATVVSQQSGPYPITQGDTSEPISGTLYDANGRLVPLPDGTRIEFGMFPGVRGMAGPNFSKAAEIVEDPGKWQYRWDPEDVAVVGPFKAKVRVWTADGPQSFPSEGYLDIIVEPVPGGV